MAGRLSRRVQARQAKRIQAQIECAVRNRHSPDEWVRTQAVRQLCPCRTHLDWTLERYIILMRHDPSALVRAAANFVLNEKLEHEMVRQARMADKCIARSTAGREYRFASKLMADLGWIDPRVVSRLSGIAGTGQYAAAPIRAGEVIAVWGDGKVITDAELCQLAASGRGYSSAAIGEDQNLLWDVVDSGPEGPGGANHSCDPNLWMQDERTVCARRDIAAGEELTIDYALFSVSPDWRMACRCGSSVCRGVVTGNDWQLPELQQRYAGHFSPFINARIRRRREQAE